MKAYVITIEDLPESNEMAERCINSAKPLHVEKFFGITPKDNPLQILEDEGIPIKNFREKYSYLDNVVSAFLSHYSLWKKCVEDNEEYTIFEHDAVVVQQIPDFINYKSVINLGAPSYGSWITPQHFGVGMLTSKPYFPGAHGYRLKPKGAQMLIDRSKVDGGPTDVFLDIRRFEWLEEFYPWCVEAKDKFSTIQRKAGCEAKHSYQKNKDKYKVIKQWKTK